MGVKGLWRLLLPIGRRISLETLEGQTLAVDASIWLTQFLKAMRDPTTGKVQPAAHLQGFVRRLCRLHFHGIRAVFVFDGPTPAIKLRELALRRKRREQFAKLDQAALQRMAKRLLAENLLNQKKNHKNANIQSTPTKTSSPSSKKDPPLSTTTSSSENQNNGMQESPPKEHQELGIRRSGNVVAGAYAEGFNPGGETNASQERTVPSNDTTQQNSRAAAGYSEGFHPGAATTAVGGDSQSTAVVVVDADAVDRGNGNKTIFTSQEDEAAIFAAIQEDILRDEQQKEQALEEAENDFDAPIHSSDSDNNNAEGQQKGDQNNNNNNNNNKKQRQDSDLQYFSKTAKRKGRSSSSRRRKNNKLATNMDNYYLDKDDDNDYETNADLISTLPSMDRKDAIEEVKRRQRLRSRQEYIPAAASPDKFSTVQLQNFLKSSQFNLNVQRMAADSSSTKQPQQQHPKPDAKHRITVANQGAKAKQQGQTLLFKQIIQKEHTVIMASDRTRRISLIREEESPVVIVELEKKRDEEMVGGRLPQHSLLQRDSAGRPVRTMKPPKDLSSSSESEGSEDVEWEDADGALPAKRTILLDSSDDENDTNSNKNGTGQQSGRDQHRKPEPSPSEFIDPPNEFRTLHTLDANDEGGEGGGFLPMDDAQQQFSARQRLSDSKPTNAPLNEVDDYTTNAGGFLPEADEESVKKSGGESNLIVLQDDSSVGSAGAPEKASAAAAASGGLVSNNTMSDQEQQDRALAQALQDMEDANAAAEQEQFESSSLGGGSVSSTKAVLGNRDNDDDDDHPLSNIGWGSMEKLQPSTSDDDRKPAAKVPNNTKVVLNVDECSDSESNIDWEEGEMNDSLDQISTAPIITEMEKGEEDKKPPANEKLKVVASSRSEESSENDESHIEWQEGEVDQQDAKQPQTDIAKDDPRLLENFNSESTFHSSKSGSGLSEDATQVALQKTEKSHHDSYYENEFSGSGYYYKSQNHYYPGEFASAADEQNDRESMETKAVLQRAEATASKIADWAGRAFRRAVREIGNSDNNQKPDAGDRSEKIEITVADDVDDENDDEDNDYNNEDDDIKAQEAFAQAPKPSAAGGEASSITTPSQQQYGNKVFSQNPRASAKSRVTSNDRDETLREAIEISDDLLKQWEAERNQRERDADTVTDEMKEEAMRLLRLFGVPYIEAPAEAEAQCAALEALGLVDGIVTEDSDVFVFGGSKVYKHVFEEKLYAEAYMAADAEKEMGLNRNALVAIAMLLGSDYTRGVRGVGIVNAMEVLQAFEVADNLKEGLSMFASWLDGFGDLETNTNLTDTARQFHEKHKTARTRWIVPPNFPADSVIQAYLNPVVDKSSEKFSWGVPDVEALVHFCAKHIGWAADETRKLLEPVVARSGQRYRQTRLDSFMKYEDGIKFANIRSKRLRAVLGFDSEKEGKKTKNGRQTE
ncbi:hypothetical protein ACA910_018294 [Epithemia clementina (nom. ined.)]